jgi:probable F420-dependent oxidoreductase
VSNHPFRFAAQLSVSPDDTAKGWAEQARKAEDLGYSTLLMPDHFGDQYAPVPALMAAADATTTLRVGTLVHANDYKHPVVLAKEAATLDLLSGGRLELGMGAGWMRSDYEHSGISYDPPSVRVDRFEEAVAVVTGLLETDGVFSFEGEHYQVKELEALPRPAQHPRPPLTIGGGGRRMLGIAAREAEVVSINVNLRGGSAAPSVVVDATPSQTKQKVQWVKDAAGDRFEAIELNSLIGFVLETEDSERLVKALSQGVNISPDDAPHMPLALFGTMQEMEEELYWRRENYGFSYFSIETYESLFTTDCDAWEILGPLVSRMTGR